MDSSNLPDSLAISSTCLTPPTAIVPAAATNTTPMNIMPVCTESVHTTALSPPYRKKESIYKHFLVNYSYGNIVKNIGHPRIVSGDRNK